MATTCVGASGASNRYADFLDQPRFGLHLDSNRVFFTTARALTLAHKCLKRERLEVVARDGIAQHYTALTIPLTGIYLNPALELR